MSDSESETGGFTRNDSLFSGEGPSAPLDFDRSADLVNKFRSLVQEHRHAYHDMSDGSVLDLFELLIEIIDSKTQITEGQ